VLGALAKAHREGRVIALNTLARQQRILPDRAEQVLERAAALGWAVRSERDGWVLARDPSTIHIAEVYRAFVFDADAVGVPQTDLGLSLRDYLERGKSDESGGLPPP
jgi:DNA-binding IscR family transcriptional regulator